jgi:hypothetical protein
VHEVACAVSILERAGFDVPSGEIGIDRREIAAQARDLLWRNRRAAAVDESRHVRQVLAGVTDGARTGMGHRQDDQQRAVEQQRREPADRGAQAGQMSRPRRR